jgi:hypothetical protein
LAANIGGQPPPAAVRWKAPNRWSSVG